MIHGTQAAITKFSKQYLKLKFKHTTINSWKTTVKKKGDTYSFKNKGRPNLLSASLLKKAKDVIIGTRLAGTVISRRRMVIAIGTGVVKASDPGLLKEFGDTLELTDSWAIHVLKDLNWTKRKGTTGKVEPSKKFIEEEKFTFQSGISKAILENDIPKYLVYLVLNLDQTPIKDKLQQHLQAVQLENFYPSKSSTKERQRMSP